MPQASAMSARSEATGGEERLAPAPTRNVEPQGARRIRHVGCFLAGHPQADVILGEQHGRDLREDLRLVAADPFELGGGEARHHDVATDGAEVTGRVFQRGAFGERAPVVPQDRGAQGPVVRAEQGRAVHLPGEPDPADRAADARVDREDRCAGRLPPVLGVLFGPQGLGALDGEGGDALTDDGAMGVEDDGLDARRADIDSEKHRLPYLTIGSISLIVPSALKLSSVTLTLRRWFLLLSCVSA
jgi:hypothetical protein